MAQALYQDYNPGIETLNWQKLKQQLLEAEKQFFLYAIEEYIKPYSH